MLQHHNYGGCFVIKFHLIHLISGQRGNFFTPNKKSQKIQVSDADGTGRCNRADLILFLSFLKKRNKILLSRFDKTR